MIPTPPATGRGLAAVPPLPTPPDSAVAANLSDTSNLMATNVPSPRADQPNFRFDVGIVGLGYVGLPTALAFHAAGLRVLGLDVAESRLRDIESERVDLLESDRSRLAAASRGVTGSWVLSSDPACLSEARSIIICVPTPVDEHLTPDLSILRRACSTVVANAVPRQVLILTSTTYVGSTNDLLVRPLMSRGLCAGDNVAVAFSPERIDPGNDRYAHEDVPRVVGGVTQSCSRKAAEVLSAYARCVHGVSSTGAAEMTKLVENTFRAVNIALANELADVAGALDLNVIEVIEAASTKPYGFMPFFPGPGVGGHCIPCDPHYLLWQLRRPRVRTPVIEQAMNGIASRPRRVVERCEQTLAKTGQPVDGARVLVVGVSYKPNVEDVRESPALEILTELAARGADVGYYDPLVPEIRLLNDKWLKSQRDPTGYDADLVVLHTRHDELDLNWLGTVPSVLDATYRMTELSQRAVV